TLTAGSGLSVTATNDATIETVVGAASLSASGGVSGAIGASIADNTFRKYDDNVNGAQALVENSDITVTSGDMTATADSTETRPSVNFAGAVAVSGGLALSGSGAKTPNEFASTTTARIAASELHVGVDC